MFACVALILLTPTKLMLNTVLGAVFSEREHGCSDVDNRGWCRFFGGLPVMKLTAAQRMSFLGTLLGSE